MKFIEYAELKKGPTGRSVRYATFRCEFCGDVVKRIYSNGMKSKSCGCRRYIKLYPEGRKYLELVCEICGTRYKQQERLYLKAKWKNRCESHRKEMALIDGAYVAIKTPGSPTLKCKKCGKKIWKGSVHCKTCAQQGISKTGENIQEKFCISCGKKLNRKADKYCLKCWNIVQDKGLSRERTKFTLSKDWKDVRTKCFGRDNYTCQDCGARNKKGGPQIVLNAHHIVPYRKSKKLRLDLANLKTLCEDCHYKLHSKDTGEDRAGTVLSSKKVRKIKKMLSQGALQHELAKKYGVSPTTISHIKNERTWGDIK